MGPRDALDRVNAFVAGALEPGEGIVATLSFCETGASFWKNAYGGALLGLISRKNRVGSRAIIVTDRRVIIVVGEGIAARPKAILGTYPRGTVRLRKFTRGPLSGSMILDLSPSESSAFNYRQAWGDQAASVAHAVSSPRGDNSRRI